MSKQWYIKNINGKDFVYQCFSFSPEIQNYSFVGEEFIGFKRDYNLEPGEIFERLISAGFEGLLPEIKKELDEIIGEGNYEYDGNEIGPDEFSLYYFIKASIYKSVLQKIKEWKDYNEFADLMWWDEKDV